MGLPPICNRGVMPPMWADLDPLDLDSIEPRSYYPIFPSPQFTQRIPRVNMRRVDQSLMGGAFDE